MDDRNWKAELLFSIMAYSLSDKYASLDVYDAYINLYRDYIHEYDMIKSQQFNDEEESTDRGQTDW